MPMFGQRIGQDFKAENFERVFSAISALGTEQPTYMGSTLWTTMPNPGGDHFEELYYTELLGIAVGTQNLEEKVPRVAYEVASAIYGNYTKYQVGFEMLNEAVDDELHGITMKALPTLGKVLAETEEYVYHMPFANGRTFKGGWQNDFLWSNNIRTIGDKQYVSSNILSQVAGASYATLAEIYRYGEEFVNEEGRPTPIKPVRIVTGPTQARKLRELIGASSNIERTNPNVPNPLRAMGISSIEIVESVRMPNPTEMWVFYDGWQENFKVIDKYRQEPYTYDKHEPRAVVHIRATRTLQFFRSNRRAALVPGS